MVIEIFIVGDGVAVTDTGVLVGCSGVSVGVGVASSLTREIEEYLRFYLKETIIKKYFDYNKENNLYTAYILVDTDRELIQDIYNEFAEEYLPDKKSAVKVWQVIEKEIFNQSIPEVAYNLRRDEIPGRVHLA